MNWSRAKTILIALLLAVNIFLLVTYIMRDNEVRRDEMTVRSDVCRILSAQGIYVDESVVPLDSVKIRPAMLIVSQNEQKSAERLFGNGTQSLAYDGTTFSGEGGSIMFSGGVFSLVYESGRSIDNSDDAKKLAGDIAAKLGVPMSLRQIECNIAENGYEARVPSLVSGVCVFDCDAEMKISSSGSVIASGKLIGGRLITVNGDIISTSALMLSFADQLKEKGINTLQISKIELGYVSKSPAAGRISLVPMIKITAEQGVFYMDMQTSRLCEI